MRSRYSAYIFIWIALLLGSIVAQSRFNPTILQDARLEPKVDGTFGFLYKTENGIQHAARGDPTGLIQGSYSYTDPTGLKVNFNYNAGSRNAPGAQQEDPVEDNNNYNNGASQQAPAQVPTSIYSSRYRQEEEQYREPEPQYDPRAQQEYVPPPITRPQESGDVYQQRRTRPPQAVNQIPDDYQYRG